MTITQAAALLGISRATVWRRYRDGEIKPVNPPNPALRRPAPLLFRREDVLRLTERRP